MNENSPCGNAQRDKGGAEHRVIAESCPENLFYQDLRQPALAEEMEWRMTTENPSDQGAGVIVGTNVREVRKALGWSQVTLGQKAGLRQGYISAIERGERCPSLERLFDLARAFDVAPSRLVMAPMTDAGEG
jgi:DNA-binding XRE family transcriptional regulator